MSQMEALVLQALVQQALGHLLQALSALQEALTLAEPEGYVRLFVDEGAPMAELLQQVLAAGGAWPYITSLLGALGVPTTQEQETGLLQTRSRAMLVEPLSEREVEVLRLLATGGSNAELAQALVVSMSTVRTHLRHIYDKLGVTNRTQAVARARELHLLAS
jgi:LuxR family maltose regulon positive regulatory protein